MSYTEEVVDLDDFYSVDSAFDKCFESLNNYQKKREELGGEEARNNLELMDFGSKIHENVNHLLDVLLSEGGVNHLEKLKEMFVFIRDFGADVGMADFTNEFNDGNNKNLLGKYKELRGRIEEKFGSAKKQIFNKIDPIIQKLIEQNINTKVPDPGSKPLTSEVELQEDKNKPLIQEEENKVITQKNEPKKKNTERNVSSTTETHEEEKNNPYIHLNVARQFKKCLESLFKYKEERESKFNIAYTSSDFKNLGLNIFEKVRDLAYILSNPDLQIISVDGDNLSVELSSQESNLNLKKLKELFLSIRKFSIDYDMYKFTTDQSDDMFKYHNIIHNICICFDKFEKKCLEKNISNENLDEIGGVFVDLNEMYCGKIYTYEENNRKDNQVFLSDSFGEKVEWYKNAKKIFVGLIRKFEDLMITVLRKLEDIDRKVSKNSAKSIYGESFKREVWEEEEQTRKERRKKEDLARKEKREKEDQEMENSLTGRTADEVLEETNKDIMFPLSEEKENSLTSRTADEVLKKTNEDIMFPLSEEEGNSLTGRTADEVLEETNEDIMFPLLEEKENSLTSGKAFERATNNTVNENIEKYNKNIRTRDISLFLDYLN